MQNDIPSAADGRIVLSRILHLGLFLPLLLTRRGAEYAALLPWTMLVAGVLAFIAGLLLFRKLAAEDRNRQISSVSAPLDWLCLAFAAFLIDLPALPWIVGTVVAANLALRYFALPASAPGPGIEARCMLLIFLPLCFLLTQTTIIHDAYQSLGILVSVALDGDLNFFDEMYLQNSYRSYNPLAFHSVRYLGTSIWFAPFLLLGHLFQIAGTLLGMPAPANGMSLPYTLSISFGTACTGLLALCLTYALCKEFFGRSSSLLASLAVWGASPAIFYTFNWPGWSHPVTAAGVAAFILFWHRSRAASGRSASDWFLLGLLGGALLLVRPVSAIVALFPIAELLAEMRRRFSPRLLAGPLAASAAAAAVFSVQLAGWYYIAGHPLKGPYDEIRDYFDFLHPWVWGTLFSVDHHGIFSWCPLLLISLLGYFLFPKGARLVGLTSAAVVLAHCYIYSSWSSWWTGVGFANRFFVDITPVFSLGLAAILSFAQSRLRVSTALQAGMLALFVLWNIFLIGQYRSSMISIGIPGPYTVLDHRLSLSEIVHNNLHSLPNYIISFVRSQPWNELYFSERLLHAASKLQLPAFAGVLAIAAAFSAGLILFCRLTLRLCCARWSSAGRALAAVITLTIVAWSHLALFAADKRTVPIGNFCVQDIGWISVRPGSPDLFMQTVCPHPVHTVDVMNFLIYGVPVGQGAEVAEISLHDENGARYDYRLRAGVDTAEISLLRPEYRSQMRHTARVREMRRQASQRASSDHFYTGLISHASLELPHHAVIKRISVRYLAPVGELVITDFFLRDFE